MTPVRRARNLLAPLAVLGLGSHALAAGDRCVVVEGRSICVSGPPTRNLPLVIYLHGYGGSGNDDALGLGRLAAHGTFL